jgi:putative cardiolipin synthase
MQAIFAAETEPKRSYRVAVRGGRLSWHGDRQALRHEPDASMRRRIVAWLVSVLPVQSQL